MRALRSRLSSLACFVCLAGIFAGVSGSGSAWAAPPALVEQQVISLPGVKGRIDHFAVDPSGQRLFVAALGNGTLEVLDLGGGKRITSISGLHEPQGVAYLAAWHRIVVATHGGDVAAYDDADYHRTAILHDMDDADNLRFDAGAKQLYVGYRDGALGPLDPATLKLGATIALPGHPESFQLEAGGPRIFVNVPPTHEIVVVDRTARSIVKHIPLVGFGANYPMALDEAGHRLFVGVRQPARLLVFDTASGKSLATVACPGDTDDLFYDAKRDRVIVIGGEGFVDVFDAKVGGPYDRLTRISTRAGARTGLWSSDLDRLYVAWPTREGKPAEIHVLAPPAPAPAP